MNIPAIIPPGLTGETAIEIGAGIANFLALYALYKAFAPDNSVDARARGLAEKRRELRDTLLAPARSSGRAAGRQKSITAVRALLERLKLTRGEEVRKASELLAQAGWRTSDALTVFLGFRLGMPLGLGILAYLLAPGFAHHISPMMRAMIGLIGIAAGAFAPTFYVKNAATKRRQKIQKGLPDALDLFVICAEAGLSLDAAVTRVAREIGASAPELGDELGLMSIELGFLPNRRDALNNLTKRVDMASIRGLVNTLVQTERYGTPLAQSLRVLASEFRNMRMMKAEEKAARLPATLTVPMIVFILPPLFVVLIGPAIIQVMSQLRHH
jgi:tight adherence protein C